MLLARLPIRTFLTRMEVPMRDPKRSPAAAAFRRLLKMILLLRNRGCSEKAIDAFLRAKFLGDLAQEDAKRYRLSLN